MEQFWQDLKFGVRLLRSRPGLTVIATLTIALGIGANTAIFSVVNTVLLKPLPYAAPEQLVSVAENDRRQPEIEGSISYPNFFDWRAQASVFERIAVHRDADFALAGTESPVHLKGQIVSHDIFQLLGVAPALGRGFTPEEERAGAALSAVISHALFERRFGSDPQVIGREVTLNQRPFTIVGVRPAGFQFPIQADPVEVWVTTAVDATAGGGARPMTERRGYRSLSGIARLRSGVSIEQARSEMSMIARRLEEQYPDNNTNSGVSLRPLDEQLTSDYRRALLVLFGAVALVLLIACANVANLLLARSSARSREIAVRAALGANRLRLLLQLLTESLLLAFVGGLLGLLLAWWGIEALLGLVPDELPRASEIAIDPAVFVFTLAVSILTGLLFGLAPALHASKTDLTAAIKEGGRGVSGGRGRLRSALVIAEVAVAMVLLFGGSLLIRTFRELGRVDLGFDARGVLTATVELPRPQYADPARRIEFFSALVERVRTLPGVEGASAILPLPLSGGNVTGSFEIEGRPAAQGEEPETRLRWIETGYFETMKIALVKGRDFSARDDQRAPRVVIVNEAFVKRHYPDQEPLGKRIRLPFAPEDENPWREIVGVIGDVRSRDDLSLAAEAEMYLPHRQEPFASMMTLAVRSGIDSVALGRAIQREVSAIDRNIPIYRVRTLEEYRGSAISQPRSSAILFGAFAAVALLLAAIGLYGVVSYSVTERRHEIGIRLALGARPMDVLRATITASLRLVAAGIAIGATAALGLGRVVESMLYGVSARDPLTFVAIALLLAAVAAIACYVPARRAARTDPMIALRYE